MVYDLRESVTMPVPVLGLIGNALGAVGLVILALKSSEKVWRISGFVLAALNVVFGLSRLLACEDLREERRRAIPDATTDSVLG